MRVVTCGVICLFCGCGPSSGPQLTVDQLTKVLEPDLESSELTYQLGNAGDKDLIIHSAVSSCGCSVVDFASDTIPPGSTKPLIVRMSRPPMGQRHAAITLVSNCKSRPAVQLNAIAKANVKESRIVRINPSTLWLTGKAGNNVEALFEIVTIEESNARLIKSVSTRITGLHAEVRSIEEVTTPDDAIVQRKYLCAVVGVDCSSGRLVGDVEIHFTKARRAHQIPITLDVTGPIVAEPNVLFGTVGNGGIRPQWVVTLTQDEPARQVQVRNASDWLGVDVSKCVDGQREVTIRVTHIPEDLPVTGYVTVSMDGNNDAHMMLPVTLIQQE